MISKAQIKLLWVQARQLGMDSDGLHEAVLGVTGKDSIKALSSKEAAEVIETLARAGAKVKKKGGLPRKLPPNVAKMPTRDQRRLIKCFEKKLDWQDNPERLKGFAQRTIKRRRARTSAEASRLIEGLKNTVDRQRRKDGANG
jgi:phage gp16-like protein